MCLQRVPVFTGSVTTVLTQMVAVNRTPVRQASPASFVIARQQPVVSRFSSVMLMQTVTSVREPSGESSCPRYWEHIDCSYTIANASFNMAVAAGTV